MSKLIDLTGQDFGYWHVIERAENRANGRAYWKCKCTACGTIKDVCGSHLRAGHTTNCGCIRMEKMRQANIKHEEGKTYGFLYVNRIATKEEKPQNNRAGIYWNCTCTKCGRENIIVLGDYLRNGDTKSCGCLDSFNESKICQILDNMNIQYKQQISFKELSSNLSFDIGIYNNNILLYIIEYDGIQHFEIGHFKDTYYKTHDNDLIKNKYCFDHHIPLIRIPYIYENKYTIQDLQLTTTRFLLTPENEKEYYEKYSNDRF